MRAEILSTGDEVRSGAVVDTNAAYIADVLEANGIDVGRHTCVGDDIDQIAEALREMARRAEVAVVTGGLGPTADDVTAEAAALAAGTHLVEKPEALVQVKRFDREAYESDAGYAGFSIAASVLRQLLPTLAVSAYVRWENLYGTVFEDSPLVKDPNNIILGCAVTWRYARSGTLVRVRRHDRFQE